MSTNFSAANTYDFIVNSPNQNLLNIDWTFSTNAFWGEQGVGNWSLTVRDVAALDTGVWNAFSIDWRMKAVDRRARR